MDPIVTPVAPNVFDTSSAAFNMGADTLAQVANPFAVNMTMNQFLNPYRNAVLDDAVSRLRDRRSESLNMVQTDAAAAGAFGGSRHGLVEAQMIDDFGRQEDELVARLLQDGFDTRFSMASQTLDQRMAAGTNLLGASTTGFNLGSAAMDRQYDAGNMQQQLLQQILGLAGQQYDQYASFPQTSLATAMAGVSGNPLAGNATQTSRYNPGLFDYLSFGTGVMGGLK